MAKNSAAKLAASNRYVVRTYETISTRARRTERVNDLIERAAAMHGETKAAYVLHAIRARLDADGVTLDSLQQD